MIFTDRTVIVQKGTSSINDTIVLYRGDREVEIRFTLNESSPFKFGSGVTPNIIEKTEAAYGQLVIKVPGDKAPIFSEITATKKGAITFTITAEMIDEITEVGNYTFQIRLLDENKEGRVTIPEVVNGIEVREPIATEDISDTNEVGIAAVGYALTTAGTTEDTFDSQGNYNKTTWGTGDRITAAKLNKIEAGIDGVNQKVASGGTGGEVDLSGYVTKETGNANQITCADGQTFQAKLDAGTLKGEKGDKGDTGEQGPQGPAGTTEANGVSIIDAENNFTSTNVEGALAELFQSVSNGKTLIASAITDKGVTTSNSDTFQTMANNISKIINSSSKPISINNCELLKEGWKFKLISNESDTAYSSKSETAYDFDDSSWSDVNIPHDWSIYNDFNENSKATFEGGYLDGGDAWYRLKLNTSLLNASKVYIYFDGIYMESDIYVNGTLVKSNKYGYNSFYCDVTNYLNFTNDILAIFVRNNQPTSRWYSGRGIYRNVYLITANEVCVGINDVFITTPNLESELNTGIVSTHIDLKINNSSDTPKSVLLVNSINHKGENIANKRTSCTLSVGKNSINEIIYIPNPNLWDEYNGNMYTLNTKIYLSGELVYEINTDYGYRYFKFDRNTGFWLNGRNLKLRGVCMHHDLGCLGAEVNYSAMQRQIKLLKNMGCNAIRLTHNPTSLEYIDICNKEGILLVEEAFDCWGTSKVSNDFARFFSTHSKTVIENMVNRDKNSPAIIMWSIGNEIKGANGSIANTLCGYIKAIDTTRYTTTANQWQASYAGMIEAWDNVDIKGFNYVKN